MQMRCLPSTQSLGSLIKLFVQMDTSPSALFLNPQNVPTVESQKVTLVFVFFPFPSPLSSPLPLPHFLLVCFF